MFRFVLKQGHETDVPRSLLTKLDLFKRKPELVSTGRYAIKSDVGLDVFALFMTRFYGAVSDMGVTLENAIQLQALCEELGFTGFDDELRAVLGRGVDLKVRQDVIGVRSHVARHDVHLEELQRRMFELERQLQELRTLPQRLEQRLEAMERVLHELQRQNVSKDIEPLRRDVSERASAADVQALSHDVSHLKEAEARPATVSRAGSEFMYRGPRELDGIIAHLTRECSGNVHEKGVVVVTASGCLPGYEPEHVVNFGSLSHFCSQESWNSWIRYNFSGWRVTLTSYSIMSYCWGPGGDHPRWWVLEVSNDGTDGSWVVVDSRENNFDLNDKFVTRNFAISAHPSGAFRFVRFRQTGKNHRGKDFLQICSLELFGTLSRE